MRPRRVAVAACACVVIALGLAFGFAPRQAIVTRVYVAASPMRVWSVMVDTAAYGAWNRICGWWGGLNPAR